MKRILTYQIEENTTIEKFLKANGINSILAGVDTDRDTFRVNGCVTCAHVYRAKGNEAPMVYIANAEYCADGMELIKLDQEHGYEFVALERKCNRFRRNIINV